MSRSQLLPDDGQPGSYLFVCQIGTEKRACVYEYRATSRVVGKQEVANWECFSIA